MKDDIKERFNLEILKLCSIFITFMTLKESNNIILNYKILKFEDFDKSFLNVLDQGFYAILRILGVYGCNHDMTIVSYVKNENGSINLIVKNSHGKDNREHNIVQKNGVIEDFKMAENIEIHYIEPIINIDQKIIIQSFEEVEKN